MKELTHQELLNYLKHSRGTVICGLLTVTDCRALKTGNPFGQIFKVTRSVGFSGANYQRAVNREAIRQDVETDFRAAKLPFGNWIVIDKVIEHKGNFYLRIQATPNQRRMQPAKVLSYLDSNGNILKYEKIKDFLPPKRESLKQQNHGLEATVMVRNFLFSNILKIRINGQTYKLINNIKIPAKPYTPKKIGTIKKLATKYNTKSIKKTYDAIEEYQGEHIMNV